MMLSLADVGIKIPVQKPVTMWLTEEQAKILGFSDQEIEAAKQRHAAEGSAR